MIVETRRVVLTEAYVAQHIKVQPGVYVLLAISDTGSGMDAEMQLHLFEPFSAQGKGAAGRFRPLGGPRHRPAERRSHLGVQRARSRHDVQDLSARSARGVARHVHRGEPRTPRRCRAGGRRCCSSKTSRACGRSRHKVLEACGYTVVTASSGEEALERCLARGLEPDLLITDVVMPGITGSQLVAHLRSHRDGFGCCTPRVSPKMPSSITAWPVASISCRSPSRLPISRIKYEKSSVEPTRPSRRS